jgi:hypothetical protein
MKETVGIEDLRLMATDCQASAPGTTCRAPTGKTGREIGRVLSE